MSFRASVASKYIFLSNGGTGSLSLFFKYHYITKLKDGTWFIPHRKKSPQQSGATAPGMRRPQGRLGKADGLGWDPGREAAGLTAAMRAVAPARVRDTDSLVLSSKPAHAGAA